jgi:hypothetical protein
MSDRDEEGDRDSTEPNDEREKKSRSSLKTTGSPLVSRD